MAEKVLLDIEKLFPTIISVCIKDTSLSFKGIEASEQLVFGSEDIEVLQASEKRMIRIIFFFF